ncbi:MAG: 4-alpha-glucanotransferase, partial [Synergistaceae bacterium]|nr:4-alpha-glucanotransferase [Synergistaceae bacterium]
MSKRAFKREAGILLPITSLPSRYGIGDLGSEAFKFADFLHEAGQSIWQVLPLTATDPGCGNSPYSPTSAFAGNYLVISPEWLVQNNLLDLKDIQDFEVKDASQIDYDAVIEFKNKIFRLAFKNFNNKNKLFNKFNNFCERESEWLDGWSEFIALKAAQGGKPWYDWPKELKFREPAALKEFIKLNLSEIKYQKFLQFIFAAQMAELREHLKKLNISLVGDVPVYVTLDCADVWQFPEIFNLDKDLAPITIAGVPPDYFS